MYPVLQTRGISKVYLRGTVPVEALREVDLEVQPGEFLAIMGPSGSGKSTLLHILGALDEPTSGEILFQGKPMPDWGKEPGAAEFRRRHLGFIFQSFNLVRSLTARENVALPLILEGAGEAAVQRESQVWLERVGLWERQKHYPYELSGGEQQRIAVARALIHKPALLLADEPTGNLDTANGRHVLDLLEAMCRQCGTTVVLVTHDAAAASRSDRVIYLRDGRVCDSWRFAPDLSRQARIQTTMQRLQALVDGEAS
jgi:putative ABC transport system ATP-binding protein